MNLWDSVGGQLRNPQGAWGRITGRAMGVVNRTPNRLAIDALDVQPDDHVLELGFGPGRGIEALAALARRGKVCGVDQSVAMLGQARSRNADAIRRGQVCLRLGRFDALPFADQSADRILAVNVIYFWGDGADVIAEIRRVLRPGGRLVIYATDASSMRRWPFAGPDTHQVFDATTLRAWLNDTGFEAGDVMVTEVAAGPGVQGLIATIRHPDRFNSSPPAPSAKAAPDPGDKDVPTPFYEDPQP
jgi:ubiquinone/menaquinone biosynthesis C-methylase UbiE